MAKSGKKRRTSASAPTGNGDPLQEAIETFARGDYARARVLLESKAHDPDLPEGQREQAEDLCEATNIEPGTLWVGLSCIGLFVLVLIVTTLTQPH